MRFYFMLHPSLVRLACMAPHRLSSLLKNNTLVALLDGTADSAQSQPVAAENVAQLPAILKRFKHLGQQPKLVDKILAAIDGRKFTPAVLEDRHWEEGAKLGVIYMYLKQTAESDLPRVYILELKCERTFLSAASQLSQQCRASVLMPVDALKKGFYRVKGCKVEWALHIDDDESEKPTMCVSKILGKQSPWKTPSTSTPSPSLLRLKTAR